MTAPAEIASVPEVCEVERWTAPGADPEAPPDLLIEVPHGATRAAEYHAVRRRLAGDLPDDLIDFFFVNTDVGAPECAREIAAAVVAPSEHPRVADLLGSDALAAVTAAPPRSVLVLRCLIPRTFVDCNRAVEAADPDYATTGVTKAVPDYVTDPGDIGLLTKLHAAYVQVASRAFDWICGAGGSRPHLPHLRSALDPPRAFRRRHRRRSPRRLRAGGLRALARTAGGRPDHRGRGRASPGAAGAGRARSGRTTPRSASRRPRTPPTASTRPPWATASARATPAACSAWRSTAPSWPPPSRRSRR